jgi:hypothetical protein
MDATDQLAAATHRIRELETQVRCLKTDLADSEAARLRGMLRQTELVNQLRELDTYGTWPALELVDWPPELAAINGGLPLFAGPHNVQFLFRASCGTKAAVAIAGGCKMAIAEIFHRLFPDQRSAIGDRRPEKRNP